MWPSRRAAWLSLHLWDLDYEFTRRQGHISETHLPGAEGASEFFLDTLQEEPKHKWLVTNPSISPENGHPFGAAVCAGRHGPAILRDLIANTIKAAETTPGVDKRLRTQTLPLHARARACAGPARRCGAVASEWLR